MVGDEGMDLQEAIQRLGVPMTRARKMRIQEGLVHFMVKALATKDKAMLVIQVMEEVHNS